MVTYSAQLSTSSQLRTPLKPPGAKMREAECVIIAEAPGFGGPEISINRSHLLLLVPMSQG